MQNVAVDLIQQVGEIKEGLNMMNKGKVAEHIHSREMLKVEKGNIEIKNAKFSYGKIKVFDGFSLSIKAGEKTGLVGKSGCGKTTLINLILRNLTLADGQILIDGKDIKNINEESLKDNFSFVSQDNTLFNRSVLENIRYAKQDATLEEVIEVAKKANAHEFITELEYGYETNVGERGMKLSGGQRQRILIARAMLKNAPVVILDEATAYTDPENEALVQSSVAKLVQGKTLLVIAHRLSTIKNSDMILVLEQGRIVERGNHEELLAQKGRYYQLYTGKSDALTA
jgi:ABC-type multidrug transport system fused ATPase/permease subunit